MLYVYLPVFFFFTCLLCVVKFVHVLLFGIDLVVITGQNSLSNLEFVRDVLESKTQLSDHISSFAYIGNRRWNIILDNDSTVKLPEDNSSSAWDYLNHLHNTTDFTFSDWSIIDMRITDKIFVKR